jgi:hypothetical protein
MLTAREKFYIAAHKQGARIAKEVKKQQENGRERAASLTRDKTKRERYIVPSDCLTLKKAANEYRRSESGIAKAINTGKLQSEKIGPYRVIKRVDLEKYFEWAAQARKESAYRAMKARCEKLKSSTN